MKHDNSLGINKHASGRNRKNSYEILVSVIALLISFLAVYYTREALLIQQHEFRIRNRPYLKLGNPQFSGEMQDISGRSFPRSVILYSRNISQIPATHVQTSIKTYLDDQEVRIGSVTTCIAMPDSDTGLQVGIVESWYQNAISKTQQLSFDYRVSYSGVLGESPTNYFTSVRLIYDGASRGFRFHDYTMDCDEPKR